MAERYRKTKAMSMEPMPMDSSKPHLHLQLTDIPEAKNWKVGNTYKIGLEVKQVELSEDRASLEILGVMTEKENHKSKRYG